MPNRIIKREYGFISCSNSLIEKVISREWSFGKLCEEFKRFIIISLENSQAELYDYKMNN